MYTLNIYVVFEAGVSNKIIPRTFLDDIPQTNHWQQEHQNHRITNSIKTITELASNYRNMQDLKHAM